MEIVREEKKMLEIVIDNLTIASLLTKYLNEDDRVEIATFKREHPLTDRVFLLLRVKEGDPRQILKENIARARADIKSLKEQLIESLR